MNIGMGKQTALFVAAIVAFAAVGLLAVLPTHAQSTTTSSTSKSNPETGSTYPSGHRCPNMSNSTSSSSSSSSSTTTG